MRVGRDSQSHLHISNGDAAGRTLDVTGVQSRCRLAIVSTPKQDPLGQLTLARRLNATNGPWW
jgi:hypothetical protein